MNNIKAVYSKIYKERRLFSELELVLIDSGICFGTFLFVFILVDTLIK